MKESNLNWLLQSAEFGISNCNVAHDINNVLAILMGYTENLEYMLESGDLNKSELQDICEKLFYVIDKLNAQSRNIASERKRSCLDSRSRDFSDYFHSWIKVNAPLFREKNLVVSFISGPEFITELSWSNVYLDLANLFAHLLQDCKPANTQKVEFCTEVTREGLKIVFTHIEGMQVKEGLQFLGKEVQIQHDNACIELLLTCFSKGAAAKSAA